MAKKKIAKNKAGLRQTRGKRKQKRGRLRQKKGKPKQKKPMVYLYTGEGGGKTVTAFGTALRALGHGQRVAIVQFMKGRPTGEYLAKKFLPRKFSIKQFGRKEFVNLRKPMIRDKVLAHRGLLYALEALQKKPDVMVLDEVNLAVAVGLLHENDVLALIGVADPKTTFILTGRRATKGLKERADFVNEIVPTKHPKKPWLVTQKGIQF